MKSIIRQTIFIFSGLFLLGASVGWMKKPDPVNVESIRVAVGKSIPVLQKSSDVFINKVHCATCHHSLLTSQVVALAKQKGIPAEDSFAVKRTMAAVGNIIYAGDANKCGEFLNVKLFAPYILMGLAAEKYPADFNTDLAVAFLISEANADGSFPGEYQRVPLESGQMHTTSVSIHAIRLYASPALRPQVDQMVSKTRTWMENQSPSSQEELTYQLLGLTWCGSSETAKKEVAVKIMKLQRPDGGWAQLASMNSDAYATGQTLFALYKSGMLHSEDENSQRALNFLLKTQEADGTWYVQSRSFLIQPFVNSQFPPGDENQFISAAATNWATLALMETLPDKIN